MAPTLAERRDRLDRLARTLAANEAPYSAAISEEFGNRSADETRMLEIGLVLNAIRYARKNLRRWKRPERRHVDIAFQPARPGWARAALGVIGIIAPWSYPLFLALGPLTEATSWRRSSRHGPGVSAAVLVVSNDPAYWTGPRAEATCDAAFSLREGRSVGGALDWAPQTAPGTKRGREAPVILRRRYEMHWMGYARTDGHFGVFRFLFTLVSGAEACSSSQ